MHGKYGADAHFIAKLKQWLKEAHEHIKHVLGLNSKAPILKAINHVLTSIETDYTSKEMLAENIKDTLYNAPPSGPSQAAKDLGKIVADANLVKTSDKKPLDSVKEGVENAIKQSTLTRLRKSWIDASAGLSKALSSLPSMSLKGELRADLLHSKNQQLYNLVRTSFEKGYLVLSEDGGLMSTDDSELALNNIFKRIDELGYPDSRKTFFTAMRVMAGESNLLHDAHQRGLAQRYEKYVKLRKKEIETLTGKERTKLINKLNGLKAEAKRIYERAGKKSLTDMQDEITTKTALAQKKEALAAATADPITKAKLTDAAAKLREAIDKLSEKTESGGVGTEKRVDAQHILDTK
jgi:hypothetical protein